MIGVIAHDAGAAEFISSYLRRNKQPFQCCLEGAARGIFARKIGAVDLLPLAKVVEDSDWLLCGTSFLSDLEWSGLRAGREAGKRTVSVIDHWVNYRQRFFRHDTWCFPDEAWLGDALGMELARRDVPEIQLKLVDNPYFLDLREELQSISAPERRKGGGLRILYVSEPLRDDGLALYGDERYWGYTEEEALRYFLANTGAITDDVAQIVVRAHPQEPRDKYAWAVEEFPLPIVTNEDKTLLQQVVASDIVVGGATMAMVVGLLGGKRVVSCLPPGARTVPLPHPEIEVMADLIAALSSTGRVRARRS